MRKTNRLAIVATLCLLGVAIVGCPWLAANITASLAWVKQAGGTGSDRMYAIDAWVDGTSISAGYFSSTATFGEGEAHETTWVSAGDKDIFVAKHNADGTLAWASAAGGTGADWGLGVAALADGGCVATGYFSGQATFGGGEANETTLTSHGGKDIFVARYATDGTLLWAVGGGSTADDEGSGITVGADASYVVTGYYGGAATFGEASDAKSQDLAQAGGGDDVFVANYSSDGEVVWVNGAGGANSDRGQGATTLTDGSYAITGYCTGSVNFATGVGVSGYGGTDLFVAKYASDGTATWARNIGSPGDDQGLAIDALPEGACVAAGFFTGTAQVICPCGAEESFVSAGNTDILVAKFKANGDYVWGEQAGGEGTDKAYAVSANADGYISVAGGFTGTAEFNMGNRFGSDGVALTSDGEDDIFLAQLTSDGVQTYAIRAGGTAIDFALAVNILPGGQDCLVAGRFRQTATFGEGAEAVTLTAPGAGPCDTFLARYNAEEQARIRRR